MFVIYNLFDPLFISKPSVTALVVFFNKTFERLGTLSIKYYFVINVLLLALFILVDALYFIKVFKDNTLYRLLGSFILTYTVYKLFIFLSQYFFGINYSSSFILVVGSLYIFMFGYK